MEERQLLKRRRKAVKDNNEAALVSVCTDLANLYMEECRYDFAIDEYTHLSNIYQKREKNLEYGVVNRGIGEAYLGLQKFEKALEHLKIYLDTAKELSNKLEEQRALATIGHTYLSNYLSGTKPDRCNLEQANKYFKKSYVVSQGLTGQVNKVELADMSARLFANLGLVQDCMGNYQNASELIVKSINLCKTHDLYEQLQRGYNSLAALLIKTNDHKSALQQYNLAVEAAKKLKNKPGILAGILLSKSEILVKLGDYHGAKNTLFKAYKLKVPDVSERETIKNNLRTVAAMCYAEDKLLITGLTEYTVLKSLYEKMGDGACDLKQYDKAIEYYKKMLDAAIQAGLDLASCYYSLAETYKDNNQFEEAIAYFEQELELAKTLQDKLNTLSKIADTKEAANAPISEVQTVYDRAIEMCQKEKNTHEEGRMLKRFILYLRRLKQHSEAFKCEQKLTKLDYHSSDSESETSETGSGMALGAEINLDEITDVSDDSDVEIVEQKPRRRSRNFQVKRNVKGETQLHTACIKGQLNVVKHLLEQGHPVNVRDNCGWLPLHEACIHGHLPVVELLLDKGAAINDRGGTQCEGITPLHDAATNGHLTILDLLIGRGANVLAKTDDGDTVLDFLKKYRALEQLTEDDQIKYELLVEQITQILERAGHPTTTQSDMKLTTPDKNMRTSYIVEDKDSVPKTTPSPYKSMRRSALAGLEDDINFSPTTATNSYRDAMENLRHRNSGKSISQRLSVTKRSALLSGEDVIDDWLEDDVGKVTKKRKTNSPRRSNENIPDNMEIVLSDSESNDSVPSKPKKNVKKRQMKLTNLSQGSVVVEADSTISPKRSEPSPSTLPRSSSFMEPTLSIDVRINGKLYRVPILLSQVNSYTIKWLADEASTRYAKKEYMNPTLELETKNGAILADDDPLSLLFPMGATQAEEVEARIVKWSLPPLLDRFKEACQDLSTQPPDDLLQVLREFSTIINLRNHGVKGSMLAPLCKVLNKQTNLIELDLSGNFLTNECFQYLGSTLPSLENLNKLNLNCTGLKNENLRVLSKNLDGGCFKVTELDLSDNFLGDQSWEYLASLTRCFQLIKIDLSGNCFKMVSFNNHLSLNNIQDFSISDNELGGESLLEILTWLNPSIVKSLDISRNSVCDSGFLKDLLINTWTFTGNLKTCKLARCHVTDSDLFDLLRISPSLEILDVSYNPHLTSVSLRKLLESDIQNIMLYGCSNILKYFTDFSKYLQSDGTKRTIKISLSENCENETENLKQMWRELYGYRALTEVSTHLLYLSLKD